MATTRLLARTQKACGLLTIFIVAKIPVGIITNAISYTVLALNVIFYRQTIGLLPLQNTFTVVCKNDLAVELHAAVNIIKKKNKKKQQISNRSKNWESRTPALCPFSVNLWAGSKLWLGENSLSHKTCLISHKLGSLGFPLQGLLSISALLLKLPQCTEKLPLAPVWKRRTRLHTACPLTSLSLLRTLLNVRYSTVL